MATTRIMWYNKIIADRVAPERTAFLTVLLLFIISGVITGDNMKKIPLTQGKFAIVDDEDFEWLSKQKWYVEKLSGYYYAGYGTFKNRIVKKYPMHRVITGAKKGEWVDHINRDTLDNRRCNLRICTPSQNAANKLSFIGSSKYKGVSFIKSAGKWYASAKINCKTINLGMYKNEEDAARAYDKKALELWGEFARINFPKNKEVSNSNL